jgi:Fur family transcriptional regulator, ferric uptake regulator
MKKNDKNAAAGAARPQDFEEALLKYKEYLRKKHLLFTRERISILEAAMARHDHFSVEELHDSLKASGKKVSRATLYRNLDHLRDAGILAEVDLGNRHVQYEHVLGHEPHIHLVCEESGEVTEDFSQELNEVIEQIALKHKFSIRTFKLQIFGAQEKRRP